jgi:hypothetical protein
MIKSLDLYVPRDSEVSVREILVHAGFEVTISERTLNGGVVGTQYACRMGQASMTVTDTPMPDDPNHRYLLELGKPDHGPILLKARALLIEHGAMERAEYIRSKNAES